MFMTFKGDSCRLLNNTNKWLLGLTLNRTNVKFKNNECVINLKILILVVFLCYKMSTCSNYMSLKDGR